MSDLVKCKECKLTFDLDEYDNCPDCEVDLIKCEVCEHKFNFRLASCPYCDEHKVPEGTECEFCEKAAVRYLQSNPVCEDHYQL
ncbi:hypothetical protein [Pseudoalteromonas sp. GB43]